MAPDAPHRRPARPVADAPIDGLLARVEDVAKGWVLALVAQAPLHEAPRVLTEPLTRDGPRVCDAALRALADDSDLRRLLPGGALRPLVARTEKLVGARSPLDTVRAIDALHDVLWSALGEELPAASDPELISQLARRLAHVCAVIREAALAGEGGPGGDRELSAVEWGEPPAGPSAGPARASWEGPAAETAAAETAAAEAAAAETAAAEAAAAHLALSSSSPSPSPSPPGPIIFRADPRPSEPGAGGPVGSGPVGSGPVGSDPVARSASRPPEEALWFAALAEEVGQAAGAGTPLALLLAELEDADRLIASASAERAQAAFDAFVTAVRGVMRSRDILVRESAARVWVIARGAARPAAHSIAAHIAEAVGETLTLGGAPLTASVGVAVVGEDGRSAAEMVDAAEEARFTASARGIEVSRRVR